MIARSLAAEAQLEENIRKVVRKARPGATSEAIEARVRHHLEGPERTVRDDDEPAAPAVRGAARATLVEALPPMQRTFYDTTELVKPFARRLHATLTEIRGNKVRVSPTVAWELGKRGAIKSPGTAISVAEAELQQKTPPLSEGQRSRLEREAWWAQQWLDRESVHEEGGAVR